jgi:hypothetical protein
MTANRGRLLLVCGAALISAMCSESSPTGPTSTTPPATTLPPTNGSVRVEVVPNPVPFSGQPITDAAGCAGSTNTWFYEQVFTESGGSDVTFRSRIDTFDGFTVNELSGLTLVVPANGTLTLRSRWCSATANEHTARSSFTGQDARGNLVTVTGPAVRLLKP